MSGWFLKRIAIEGFRGINNESDPLVLKFDCNSINSISAPNGVGKSSIYDALTFAIRGRIQKLDILPSAERGGSYYVNLFHSKGEGSIQLLLEPTSGGAEVELMIKLDALGNRKVISPAGIDGEAILKELDREFVLLDQKTLQSFIDSKDLERGRSFSGLLGLADYSRIRQELKALNNSQTFNNHFAIHTLAQQISSSQSKLVKIRATIAAEYQKLTSTDISELPEPTLATTVAFQTLSQIKLLEKCCEDKDFFSLDLDQCEALILEAEGGDKRKKYTELVAKQADLEKLATQVASDESIANLIGLTDLRDKALNNTHGQLLQSLYKLSSEVLQKQDWPNENICPTCDHTHDTSVLVMLDDKLSAYEEVEDLAIKIGAEWISGNWKSMENIEAQFCLPDEPKQFEGLAANISKKCITHSQFLELCKWKNTLTSRLSNQVHEINLEVTELANGMPSSLVTVIQLISTARQLKQAWMELEKELLVIRSLQVKNAKVERIRRFLKSIHESFALAESVASERRLITVVPQVQAMFDEIMSENVTPYLKRPAGKEDLIITLTKFWGKTDLSAQALLSESYRNALAISVYLASALLYCGKPHFVVLDDVTSSLDGGHQFQLMELIRTKFARPSNNTGMQVILLTHDTLLEKLCNKNSQSQGWRHQRIEGNARTSVLTQTHSGNHLKQVLEQFLNAGRIADAEPRMRQYLEYKLLEIIDKVNIPVPMSFAIDDNKKMIQASLDAINVAVALHKKAGSLILTAAQESGLNANVATITGNYLAHYATGSGHAFNAGALQGVLKAIDSLASCFMKVNPKNLSEMIYYKSLG